MPEGTEEATLLIATSWQALNRAISGNKRTLITDCTVMILFATFFVESNLNYIIEELNQTNQMRIFFKKRYPGLQDKLGWFYNEYVAKNKATNRKQLYQNGIKREIRRKFPGFAKLYKFRNDISHGSINSAAKSLDQAVQLRKQAKVIVDGLFAIAFKASGSEISRVISYSDAISS